MPCSSSPSLLPAEPSGSGPVPSNSRTAPVDRLFVRTHFENAPEPDLPAPPATLERCRAEALEVDYPVRLRALKRPPAWIEAEGPLCWSLDRLSPAVAIVGTRHPSEAAARYATELAAALAAVGVVVISGGALGIDAAAHRGALAAGAPTVVVLPGAITAWCPASNAALFRLARRRGALVSIRAEGERPDFFQRNAVMAALSDHVVVVSAPLKSGARNTAAEARALGRPVWVVPGSPWDPTMAGCAMELGLGARPLCHVDDLLTAVGRPVTRPPRRAKLDRSPGPKLPFPSSSTEEVDAQIRTTPEADRTDLWHPPEREGGRAVHPPPRPDPILSVLASGPCTADELILRTRLPAGRLRASLLTWTVQGVLREGPVGVFRLVNS